MYPLTRTRICAGQPKVVNIDVRLASSDTRHRVITGQYGDGLVRRVALSVLAQRMSLIGSSLPSGSMRPQHLTQRSGIMLCSNRTSASARMRA